MSLDVAVCFCIFNRPDTTRRVFDRIRDARPARLLVVGDGPRADRPGEADLVRACREIVSGVDWPCRVETCYSETNLGCARRMSSGLTWAFSQADPLIVLEDDCVPDPSFFGYCQELLVRANDARVAMISGDCFAPATATSTGTTAPASYRFSTWAHIWGWASWRRAWAQYDLAIRNWPRLKQTGALLRVLGDRNQAAYWTGVFDAVHAGQIDTWDYSWQFTVFRTGGLVVLPSVNLVSNIGLVARGTHTRDPA
jgi:hypothetical protein